jgi:Phage spike trimer/GpV Apex motif
MSKRKGIVVATHPEDHSVDLVMVDNGERLIGVQLQTPSGSTRTGSVDLPEVPEKKDKWDITQDTGQDMHAIVDYVGRTPIVTGFLYPQINQMLFKDPKMRFNRHQSDVMSYTDGDGNFGIMHPSGAFIQVGEKPEKPELENKNADQSLKPDRNTGKKVYLRVALAGNVAELTMTPDGTCTLKLEKDLSIECDKATVKAPGGMTFDTPEAHFTGKVTSDGDQVAGGISQINHVHGGVQSGGSKTQKPE